MKEPELYDEDYVEVLTTLVAMNMFTAFRKAVSIGEKEYRSIVKDSKYFCGVEKVIKQWDQRTHSVEWQMGLCKELAKEVVSSNRSAKEWEAFTVVSIRKVLDISGSRPFEKTVTTYRLVLMGVRKSGAFKNHNPSHAS